MRRQSDFRGRSWSFPPRFGFETGKVYMVEADQDIHESLALPFSTAPGERFLAPDYGCDLAAFLFETMDETALAHLKTVSEDAVLYHEPRILIDDVAFDASAIGDGVLRLALSYRIEATNARSNFVWPFYLSEATLAPPC